MRQALLMRRDQSEVVVVTNNGYGSTNTKIRRFTTVQKSVGSAIVYAESAADGASFTIQKPGLYSLFYMDAASGGATAIGVSVNSAELTTNVTGITTATLVGWGTAHSNSTSTFTCTRRFAAGDILRPHSNGTCDVASAKFSITRVGE